MYKLKDLIASGITIDIKNTLRSERCSLGQFGLAEHLRQLRDRTQRGDMNALVEFFAVYHVDEKGGWVAEHPPTCPTCHCSGWLPLAGGGAICTVCELRSDLEAMEEMVTVAVEQLGRRNRDLAGTMQAGAFEHFSKAREAAEQEAFRVRHAADHLEEQLQQAEARLDQIYAELGCDNGEDRFARAIRAVMRLRGVCPVCGHEWSRHDPADGRCDAHSDEHLGECSCGRDLAYHRRRNAELSTTALAQRAAGQPEPAGEAEPAETAQPDHSPEPTKKVEPAAWSWSDDERVALLTGWAKWRGRDLIRPKRLTGLSGENCSQAPRYARDNDPYPDYDVFSFVKKHYPAGVLVDIRDELNLIWERRADEQEKAGDGRVVHGNIQYRPGDYAQALLTVAERGHHCTCREDVQVGNYANQIAYPAPDHIKTRTGKISLDACIADEVHLLWEQGITTTAACCGHRGKAPAGITVAEADEVRMRSLGYEPIDLPPSHAPTFKPIGVPQLVANVQRVGEGAEAAETATKDGE